MFRALSHINNILINIFTFCNFLTDKRARLFSRLKYLKCEMTFLQETHQLNKHEDLKKDGRVKYFIPILILRHVGRNNKKKKSSLLRPLSSQIHVEVS